MAQQGNADPEILKRFKWMLRDKNLTQMELSERLNFSRTLEFLVERLEVMLRKPTQERQL